MEATASGVNPRTHCHNGTASCCNDSTHPARTWLTIPCEIYPQIPESSRQIWDVAAADGSLSRWLSSVLRFQGSSTGRQDPQSCTLAGVLAGVPEGGDCVFISEVVAALGPEPSSEPISRQHGLLQSTPLHSLSGFTSLGWISRLGGADACCTIFTRAAGLWRQASRCHCRWKPDGGCRDESPSSWELGRLDGDAKRLVRNARARHGTWSRSRTEDSISPTTTPDDLTGAPPVPRIGIPSFFPVDPGPWHPFCAASAFTKHWHSTPRQLICEKGLRSASR